ncbi:hypothetical protein CYLTODRAFT_484931 [Cylindrobasidium torrendii FP15055 ss-10]|uniref:Uncharacterized protein n=1 Tax=Cylindrobasidium torrendii FP15055 ss-10 TaxID=1314674 RepID=A0A0D7BUM2_9AGAR|nr:hypothetical protein CYLTODRAFT_484931 [Cylindrobasidium torrendii FP15055 ss-10]
MSTTIECGPEFYEKRRREWLTPKPNKPPASSPPAAVLQTRQRLAEILDNPKRAHTEAAWREALKNVWSSFGSGRALSWPLPMTLVIRLAHVAWVRDNTWPAGQVAPDPDDELPPEPTPHRRRQ